MSTKTEFKPSTATAVWIATAMLHKENKERDSFQAQEIARKVKELGLLRASDGTLNMHISLHCVANKKPSPDKHRKLYRVAKGWYRLFKKGDDFHELRDGEIVPDSKEIPHKFRHLLSWYETDYCKKNIAREWMDRQMTLEGVFTSQIENDDGYSKIPEKIMKILDVKKDDRIAFVKTSRGSVTLLKLE